DEALELAEVHLCGVRPGDGRDADELAKALEGRFGLHTGTLPAPRGVPARAVEVLVSRTAVKTVLSQPKTPPNAPTGQNYRRSASGRATIPGTRFFKNAQDAVNWMHADPLAVSTPPPTGCSNREPQTVLTRTIHVFG